MADEYIVPRIEVDPETILDEMNDEMAVALPGWVPSDAQLEAILFPIIARLIAENREFASEVLTLIFRAWGAFLGVEQIAAAAASASATWTAVDDAGYTIAEGAQVSIRSETGAEVGFEVRDETIIAPLETVAAGVVLVALVPGAEGSDLTGDVSAIDGDLEWVSSITLDSPTAGGVDEEDPDIYLNRLTAELQLLSRQPILADDFAVIALRTPGVARALALDLYNPVDQTFDNELMVTLALVDAEGFPVPSPAKAAVVAELEALRGQNFVVNAIDPTYTTVNVTFIAVAYPGFNPATVQADATAQLETYLSPAQWGRPPFGDPGAVPGWISEGTVRLGEVAEQLNRVDGVHYVYAALIGASQDATAAEATDFVTVPGHGFVDGDTINLTEATGGAPLVQGQSYFVRDKTTNTFKVANTSGGTAIDITTDMTAGKVTKFVAADLALDGAAALTEPGVIYGQVAGS